MSQRFIRRNYVVEPAAAAIAAGSALAAAFAGASPTGSATADAIVVFGGVAAVVWAAASAQWWASSTASGIGAAIAVQPVMAIVGALGFFGGLLVGLRRRDLSQARALVAGIALNTLIRSDLDGFFGLSAIIGISVSITLGVLGLLRRPSRVRGRAYTTLGVLGGLLVSGLAAVAVAGVGARPDVTRGSQLARQAVDSLNTGDYQGAAVLFEQASVAFENATASLGGELTAPSRLFPGIAQNVSAGTDMSEAAALATTEAAAALRQVDPSRLTVQGGRIDLGEIRAVEQPLVLVQTALDELRAVVDDVQSPWLIGAVQNELADLDEEFAKNEPRLKNAIDAVRLAPQMLGSDRARRYLLMFTSPAEARGLGGFVGSFAVLEVDNGALNVADFGRTSELSEPTSGADCSACDPELLQRYGGFGFTTGEGGTTGRALFSNVTMPAHYPYVAEAVAVVYPQGRNEQLDGVLVLDPYVVQALMKYSGPIAVPELDTVVAPADAARFILEDQYVLAEDKGIRVEALDTLGTGAIAAALSRALPDPTVVARDLGPLVAERRLLMWTDDPDEQDLLDRVGLLGSIPELDERDAGFSVSVTNANANKIDVFLEREVSVRIDESGGRRRLVANVRLTNTAPASGLPNYVIGNVIGLPKGSSRLYVTFYGNPLLEQAVEVNGEDLALQALPEAGWMGFSNYYDLAPGESREFELVFRLPPRAPGDTSPSAPTLWEQPLSTRAGS